jgi:Lipocalin-like domain
MKRRIVLNALGIALLAALLAAGGAQAQQPLLKDQLVGTWTLVSVADIYENGRKVDDWGKAVGGAVSFDANGRFMYMIIGGNLPDRTNSPRVSSRMVVAYYGRYAVDEAKRTVTYTADRSTNPGFDGGNRTVTVALNGDDMTQRSQPLKTPRGTLIPETVFKRSK